MLTVDSLPTNQPDLDPTGEETGWVKVLLQTAGWLQVPFSV